MAKKNAKPVVEEVKEVEVKKEIAKEQPNIVKPKILLKNVAGEDMNPEDYFYSDGSKEEKERGYFYPSYFNKTCGSPVDREELLEIFNKIFKPEDNFLFYKTRESEVYVVIVPIKFASTISAENNSVSGDYQKHSMSFIAEGAANPETLKIKLKRVAGFVRYENK